MSTETVEQTTTDTTTDEEEPCGWKGDGSPCPKPAEFISWHECCTFVTKLCEAHLIEGAISVARAMQTSPNTTCMWCGTRPMPFPTWKRIRS
jgi:hypothetical protein